MSNRLLMLMFVSIFPVLMLFNYTGCKMKPDVEELPLSVTANLNFLQENPQFVMYVNFKNMRRTEFWERNLSDSLLNAEKTFGSILNTFKLATGASISNGLDELYYSNSWFGENAVVLKGIFDRKQLENYLTTDSIFSVTKNAAGTNIYIKNDNGLYFFFRDDFTICASNYLKQIDAMLQVKDTSTTGLLTNQKVVSAINNIVYKQNIWMVSNEKFFIRGIFQNFVQNTTGSSLKDSVDTSKPDVLNDSAMLREKITIDNLYQRLNSISFSAKMTDELKINIQGECSDEESAKYLQSLLNGVITIAKLSGAGKQKGLSSKTFDKLDLDRYGDMVYVELNVDENNLQELRKSNLMNEPQY